MACAKCNKNKKKALPKEVVSTATINGVLKHIRAKKK